MKRRAATFFKGCGIFSKDKKGDFYPTMKLYDTAIFGATFLGLSALMKCKNSILIEKGGCMGTDFVSCYKVCPAYHSVPVTESGKVFYRDLLNRKLISAQGDIYPSPIVYVLSSYLKETDADLLFMTDITDISKKDGFYLITVFHANGFEQIGARRILDTTVEGILQNCGGSVPTKKTLNSVIYNPDQHLMEGLSYLPSCDLYIYELPADLSDSRDVCVEKYMSRSKLFHEHSMKIYSIASDFSYTMTPCHTKADENFFRDPSAAYPTLLDAFDRGILFAERMDEHDKK